MINKYLQVGKIVTTHGVRGEVKLQPWGNDPDNLCKFKVFYTDKEHKPMKVLRSRNHSGMILLQLEGVDTKEKADTLRGLVLCMDRDDDDLEEGQYYWQDLMGIEVIDVDTGNTYGKICDISETGANLVYHIKFADGSIKLIPAIEDVVIDTNVEENIMKIRPLKGLFDDDDAEV